MTQRKLFKNILLKGITKTIKNETKEQKRGFLSMLLGYSRSKFVWKFVIRKRNSKSWLWSQKRNCQNWLWIKKEFLVPPHPLTNFEIQKYYENEARFNGVFSRDNLPKTIKMVLM